MTDSELNTLPQRKLARLRLEAGLARQAVAAAMRDHGFLEWQTTTVVNLEREHPRRHLSLAELVTLAALYRVPAVELLVPDEDEIITLPNGERVDRERMFGRLLGRDGRLGTGGLDWQPDPQLVDYPSLLAIGLWAARGAEVSATTRTAASQAAQFRSMLLDLPDDEIRNNDELGLTTVGAGWLLVVRARDGALYALDTGDHGVIRWTTSAAGEVTATRFTEGNVTFEGSVDDVPPEIRAALAQNPEAARLARVWLPAEAQARA